MNMRSQKTKKRRKNKCFNFLTKCPELKIQNDTSSYHDCIGLHFPGVEVGIINNNGGYAIPHCFSCCNTMLYNSEQHATITEGRVYSIFCYFYYRMSSLHNFNTTYFRTHYSPSVWVPCNGQERRVDKIWGGGTEMKCFDFKCQTKFLAIQFDWSQRNWAVITVKDSNTMLIYSVEETVTWW